MKLKKVPPPPKPSKYSANVHSTGRLGFTIATSTAFEITTAKGMELFFDEDDTTHSSIYGKLVNKDDPEAYKIAKNGDYLSVSAKDFFDSIGLKYEGGSISYNIDTVKVGDDNLMRFTQKPPKTKK